MKILIFNDSQSLEVQAVYREGGKIRIRVIHATPDELKSLFKDHFATKKLTLKEGTKQTVYENYTVFSYILEDAGGIFEVGMIQEGKDTETRLGEIEETVQEADAKADEVLVSLQMAIAELTMLIASLMPTSEGGGEGNV